MAPGKLAEVLLVVARQEEAKMILLLWKLALKPLFAIHYLSGARSFPFSSAKSLSNAQKDGDELNKFPVIVYARQTEPIPFGSRLQALVCVSICAFVCSLP